MRTSAPPSRRLVQGDRYGACHHNQRREACEDERVDHGTLDQRPKIKVDGQTLEGIDLIGEAGRGEGDSPPQEIAEKGEVLDRNRLVESVLVVVDRPLCRAHARPEHDVPLVAGQQVFEDEYHRRHTDDHQCRLENAADEVSEHLV